MALDIESVFGLLFPGGYDAARRIADGQDGVSLAGLDYPLWFEDIPDRPEADGPANARSLLRRHIKRRLKDWEANDPWVGRVDTEVPEAFKASDPELVAAFPRQLNDILHVPPRLPYDVFLIAAYLIESAGIYHHIQPEKHQHDVTCEGPGHPHEDPARHIAITESDLAAVAAAADAWRQIPVSLVIAGAELELAAHLVSPSVWTAIEPLFQSWVVVFGKYQSADLYIGLSASPGAARPPPGWWFHVWRLLAIADEAARGTGFQINLEELLNSASNLRGTPWFILELNAQIVQFTTQQPALQPPRRGRAATLKYMQAISTLSRARREIATVLPKVRTPAIGCTLRSLSHHLAFLPGYGTARGKWLPNYLRNASAGPMPDGQMNLLLVPFPYTVGPRAFCGSVVEKVPDSEKVQYGYFDVHQEWLAGGRNRSRDLVTFLDDLLRAAKAQASQVNGVVFPELSLDHETFVLVREHLRKEVPEIELLVAGVSSSHHGRTGNFVAVTSFQRNVRGSGLGVRETVREKHHRWKLEAEQLRVYGLLGVLSPEVAWWENIALLGRRVDFTVLRDQSVLSALICEDLARVDPCQQLLRAVGPNLVIALLMDAPQVNGRWPARYATVLAEDPGCAVLTLTSRGLMTRQHRLGIHPSKGGDRYVAMWRDDRNSDPKSLDCPYDAQGVLLTIVEQGATDVSLDGRIDRGAKLWRYSGHFPVRIPGVKEKHDHILGEDDVACW